MAKYKYTFKNGNVKTSDLEKIELVKRMRRLDVLRVMTECHDEGCGKSICNKALSAYDKSENFTGIIRLTVQEKDWLSYKLESDMLDEEDIEVVKFYCKIK